MKVIIYILFSVGLVLMSGCYTPPAGNNKNSDVRFEKAKEEVNKRDIATSQSVKIPQDRSRTPIAGEVPFESPDTVLYISQPGQKFEVKLGQEVNFIYDDNINPDETYFSYESTYDGYILELHKKTEPIEIEFKRMCQRFIVADPNLTIVVIPETLRYEQIIWTPRRDGTWEVRIGTTERGCHSKAVNELRKLRTKEYEKSIPK